MTDQTHASPVPGDTLLEPISNRSSFQVALEEVNDLEYLGRKWRDLEGRSEPSIFQSWGWIGTWLRMLPPSLVPRILVVEVENRIAGLAVVFFRVTRRHSWLRSRGVYLNETGNSSYDALTIEYNGILAEKTAAAGVIAAALEFLVEQKTDWDELFVSGVDARYQSYIRDASLSMHLISRQPCAYVDLDAVRESGGDYLACLSRNTRSQLRRALRRYNEIGETAIVAASDSTGALQYFSEMKSLHQDYWIGRGQPGSFNNPFFETFHRAFIEDRFADGEIEMLRVNAGKTVVGYLYNFRHNGFVYAYQSGFNYTGGNVLKPGIVSHYLAVQRNLERGESGYDFMAGEAQHKKSLGTHQRELLWLSARRDRVKYQVEDMARWIKSRMCGGP